MTKKVTINGVTIGTGCCPYTIAELSGNHNGDLQRALDLMEMAASCGVNAIKLQTYTPDTMTIPCEHDDFLVKGGLWDNRTLYDLYDWAHTPWEWHSDLFDKAKQLEITCFSTPFDESAVDFLETFDVPAYKVASFEILDLDLIEYIARTGKPMIISTGMANENEIADAIEVVRRYHGDIVLLHCVSGYPTPVEQSHLSSIAMLANRFDLPVGLSDHTLGLTTSIAATALGSCLIEKHFIDSRSNDGPDSAFSMEPAEFAELVNSVKQTWEACGDQGYELKPVEKASLVFRRSLYFVADLKPGDIIEENHVRKIRPGFGIAPKYLNEVIGRKVLQPIQTGTAVQWELIEGGEP